MVTKTKLIFNPIADMRRAWPIADRLRPMVDQFGGADWSGTVYPTHAAQLALQAAQEGYRRVVALGGDGTVHEVVNGLMRVPAEERPELGIVPIGSGNDFAKVLGVPLKPEEALRRAFLGRPQPVDIGWVRDGGERDEYWVNTMGIGFDAAVNIRSRRMNFARGFSVYLLAALQSILLNFVGPVFDVAIDDQHWRERILMFTLANGRQEGGGFHVAPRAELDDGYLEYLTIGKINRLQMLYTMPFVIRGTQERFPYVRMGQFRRLSLHADRPLQIHLDGEIFAGFDSQIQDLEVEVKPAAVNVLL